MKSEFKYWRNERRLTQFELAELSGISRAVIQLIEQGFRRPRKEEIEKIATVLDVPAHYFEVETNDIESSNSTQMT